MLAEIDRHLAVGDAPAGIEKFKDSRSSCVSGQPRDVGEEKIRNVSFRTDFFALKAQAGTVVDAWLRR